MVVTQACKLNHPPSHLSLGEVITSLFFEPISHSLALMHSDSSILLSSSISVFPPSPSPSIPSPPPPPPQQQQTLIPPYSTSSCFLRLLQSPNSPNGRVLFIVAGPHNGGSRVLLRFYILRKNKVFAKAKVSSSQKDLKFDDKLGVVVDLSHGFSVKIVGSVNFFALHSVSARKIWVFAAKMVSDEDDSMSVNLMKCAVIDCTSPIFTISVSLGFMLLGEEDGVRVFPLRSLVKGKVKKYRDSGRRREISHQNGGSNSDLAKNLPNGGIRPINGSNNLYFASPGSSKYMVYNHSRKTAAPEGTQEIISNDCTTKTDGNHVSAKLRIAKLKQDSGIGGALFVAFQGPEVQSQKSKTVLASLKAVSVHALSHKRFLVLDSGGDLHLLSLCGSLGTEITGHMRHLSHTMKVQMLAVLPDISTRMQTFWVSDGLYTVQTLSIDDVDTPVNEDDKNETEEKLMQISDFSVFASRWSFCISIFYSSVIRAIFASEKIQDIIPLSTNAILVLGQGKVFAYANS